MNKGRSFLSVLLLSLLFNGLVYDLSVAQELAPILSIKAKQHSDFLLFPNGTRLAFHDEEEKSFLTLYNEANQQLDQYEFQSQEKPLLLSLGDDRWFLELGDFAYNFAIANEKITLEKKVEISPGPKGTVDRIHFFDRAKSVRVYLNELEQYNIYIDSANVRLKEMEKYNTRHYINSQDFVSKPESTPKAIYSQWSKELFFHLPAEVSFLSIDLKTNEISIGVIYMEYKQSYTFRRYFDEWKDERYTVKEDGDENPELFSVSSFGVIDFSEEYYGLKEENPIQFVPVRIINGMLLYQKVEEKNDQFIHSYYLISPEAARQKNFLNESLLLNR